MFLADSPTDQIRDFPGEGAALKSSFIDQEMPSVVVVAKKHPFNVNAFLNSVDGGRTVASYRKGQTVFSQGDPADSVFYVQEGQVKVFVISEQGKEAVVALHGGGDFFGEGCLTGQSKPCKTLPAGLRWSLIFLEQARFPQDRGPIEPDQAYDVANLLLSDPGLTCQRANGFDTRNKCPLLRYDDCSAASADA